MVSPPWGWTFGAVGFAVYAWLPVAVGMDGAVAVGAFDVVCSEPEQVSVGRPFGVVEPIDSDGEDGGAGAVDLAKVVELLLDPGWDGGADL